MLTCWMILKTTPGLGIAIGKNCSIKSKGKGKSGGARVITHLIVNIEDETLYLLKIYDKADQDNIGETELKQLLAGIKNT